MLDREKAALEGIFGNKQQLCRRQWLFHKVARTFSDAKRFFSETTRFFVRPIAFADAIILSRSQSSCSDANLFPKINRFFRRQSFSSSIFQMPID